jgi:hypothetical protein
MKNAQKRNVTTAARRVREGREILRAAIQQRVEMRKAADQAHDTELRARECLAQAEHCLSEAIDALPV